MSKNLYERTLAIAKQREVERVSQMEEKFHAIITERCNQLLKDLRPWEKNEHFLTEFNDFVWGDLYQISRSLGYHIIRANIGGFLISIPNYKKGVKSPAQLMLSQFNSKFETRKFKTERLAQDACEYVTSMLEAGTFNSCKCSNGSYDIHVPMTSSFADIMFGGDDQICMRVYRSEVERLLASEGLPSPTCYASTWLFNIK